MALTIVETMLGRGVGKEGLKQLPEAVRLGIEVWGEAAILNAFGGLIYIGVGTAMGKAELGNLLQTMIPTIVHSLEVEKDLLEVPDETLPTAARPAAGHPERPAPARMTNTTQDHHAAGTVATDRRASSAPAARPVRSIPPQGSKKMMLCSQFAPIVMRKTRNARYQNSGNGHLTCGNIGGRYWDRTSDLFGVNADAANR